MQYREMPKSGDRLSILGFGLMRLPQKKGVPGDGRIDEARAISQVRGAIDRGVNYLDTAMPYHLGGSEPFVAKALTDGYRDKVRIATKLPPWSVKKTEDLAAILNAQLTRMATDRIDYYLLHALEKKSWEKMKRLGVLELLDHARADGRIGSAGFSFHGDLDTFRGIVDAYDWDFCQIQYNYLDENNQAGTAGLRYAAAKHLGVIVMEPLRGGNLAGRVPDAVAALWAGAPARRSPAEWSLKWVWNHPEVTVVLSGMNDERHIDENIRIAGESTPGEMTAEALAIVTRVAEAYRELMKANCTGCRYCMPCPAGVDIPGCFETYNSYHMFNDRKAANTLYLGRHYGAFGTEPKHASLCQHCGKCEEKCPQGLPIQTLLEDVTATFETRSMKMLAWVAKRFFDFQRWQSVRQGKAGRRSES